MLPTPGSADLTVGQLVEEFLVWARSYYRSSDGRLSRTVENLQDAIRPLLALFLDVRAAEFGPRALKLYRQHLIYSDISRQTINNRVGIVRRVFRWAAQEERIPAALYHGLLAVEGLKRGRCGVREALPVECVPQEHIDAVLPLLPAPVQAMVRLQLWTGMRPGEAVILRLSDIDMTGSEWLYRPEEHKNSWRGHDRVVVIGPRGQARLNQFRRPGCQGRYLFSPTEAEIARHALQRAARRTPLYPSHVRAQAKKRTAEPQRHVGERYDVMTYARAIRRACIKGKRPGARTCVT